MGTSDGEKPPSQRRTTLFNVNAQSEVVGSHPSGPAGHHPGDGGRHGGAGHGAGQAAALVHGLRQADVGLHHREAADLWEVRDTWGHGEVPWPSGVSVFSSWSVCLLQVSGSHSRQEEEDHPADHVSGPGAPVRDAAHRPAGGERGHHGEAAGRLPEGPQARLLLRCLHVMFHWGGRGREAETTRGLQLTISLFWKEKKQGIKLNVKLE